MRSTCYAWLWVTVLAGILAIAGCGHKIVITQYPAFYTEDLKNIAVVPFRNATNDRNAGAVIGENLSRALMQNNTYRVFSQNDLAALESQRDLMIYAETGDAAGAASKFRPGGKVQAILVGTVTTYSRHSDRQTRVDPVERWDDQQQRMVVVGHRQYQYTRNDATVSASAALIRVSDGTQIHATAEAVGTESSEGEVPRMAPAECLRRAADKAVWKLVEEFAVTRKTIKFSDKDFRTATENYDNKWTYADRFGAGDEWMYVVLKLPVSCDRNHFKITIVRQGDRKDVAAIEFNWDRHWPEGGQGFKFSPAKIAEAGGGPGVYTAKFYSGPDVAATHDFRIEPGPAKRKGDPPK